MSEKLKESLSAVIDSEADEFETRRVLDEAATDAELKQTWERVKGVMAPRDGGLDPLTKELIYMAVSVANGCQYCVQSHTAMARAKGMTDKQHAEFVDLVMAASSTNALATALQTPVDEAFEVK